MIRVQKVFVWKLPVVYLEGNGDQMPQGARLGEVVKLPSPAFGCNPPQGLLSSSSSAFFKVEEEEGTPWFSEHQGSNAQTPRFSECLQRPSRDWKPPLSWLPQPSEGPLRTENSSESDDFSGHLLGMAAGMGGQVKSRWGDGTFGGVPLNANPSPGYAIECMIVIWS